jgi:hypothetical protein
MRRLVTGGAASSVSSSTVTSGAGGDTVAGTGGGTVIGTVRIRLGCSVASRSLAAMAVDTSAHVLSKRHPGLALGRCHATAVTTAAIAAAAVA